MKWHLHLGKTCHAYLYTSYSSHVHLMQKNESFFFFRFTSKRCGCQKHSNFEICNSYSTANKDVCEMVEPRQNQFSPISYLCIPVHPGRLLLVWLQKTVGVIVLLCGCRSNWPTWISLPHSLQTSVPEGDWCVLYTTHSQIITLVSITSLRSWCWLHATSTDVASSL